MLARQLMFDKNGGAVAAIKAELRSAGLKRRDGIAADIALALAHRLAEVGPRLISEFRVATGQPVISLFAPIGSEPDVMPLALALHHLNLPLVLPVDWSHGTPLVYRRWRPGDRLARGPLGIGEPPEGAAEVDPDLLFVPMIAFDRRGHRIGYGAGNVDRTLRALRRRRQVRAIGVAYACQEELLIPNETHDEPLDLVVTEREIIEIRLS